jgi:hypothetical protein
MSLPERGWKGYGRPHGLRVRVVSPLVANGNPCGVYAIERDEGVADARMAIQPDLDPMTDDLKAELRRIWEAA